MERRRSSNGIGLHRPGSSCSGEHRDGVLEHLDRNLLRGGAMRELIIIAVILIIALIIWKPRKGERK